MYSSHTQRPTLHTRAFLPRMPAPPNGLPYSWLGDMPTPRRLPRPGQITITKALMLMQEKEREEGMEKESARSRGTSLLTTPQSHSTSVSTSAPSPSSLPPNTYFSTTKYFSLLSPLSPLSPLVQVEHGAPLAEITAFRGVCSVTLWLLNASVAGRTVGTLVDIRWAEF
ncbi:hypothetical protein EDB85DRAFT_1547189 [Lactarius pseudohatsudake]|nr:hypothetical protein EDB85DRAFT_1547189 [Lactarius pseudohatsudake]